LWVHPDVDSLTACGRLALRRLRCFLYVAPTGLDQRVDCSTTSVPQSGVNFYANNASLTVLERSIGNQKNDVKEIY
jgi:hypothetical protein